MKKDESPFEALYYWFLVNYSKVWGAVVYVASMIFILAILTNTIRV